MPNRTGPSRFLSTVAQITIALLLVACGEDSSLRKAADLKAVDVIGNIATSSMPDVEISRASQSQPRAFDVTEVREPCAHYNPLRQPLFGDTHVHSSFSFDSYISQQRNSPWDAYRYAKGEAITLPDGNGNYVVKAQISRPIDFTVLTDHAEYFGEMNVCTNPDDKTLGYYWPMCMLMRSEQYFLQMVGASEWAELAVSGVPIKRSWMCSLPGVDCEARAEDMWDSVQKAAEDHYDRSEGCSFSTFVGYEYTDAPEFKNMHRNVVFRNKHVVKNPITTYDTGHNQYPELWRGLKDQCIDGDELCDVMTIPHNPNLSGGLMFPDPISHEQAELRSELEMLVELTQHKASSECRFDRLLGRGVDTTDEWCTFEQHKADNLAALGVIFGMEVGTDPTPLDEFPRRNMVRNTLKDGLALQQKKGINPFKLGMVGSTDTHSATPGGAEEDNYQGHLGKRDATFRNIQDHFFDNPGGLAVVWAEENSRDSIFSAMRRREAYATSGTRPTVRFFGGWNYAEDLCSSVNSVEQGYGGGVPMGSDLPARPNNGVPRFVVMAQQDGGKSGTALQQIQVVKGWVDENGSTHEKVLTVAGDRDNEAWVDEQSCAPTGPGHTQLCEVWTDTNFEPNQGAFYYARVLENPSCRWTTHQCMAAGVNPFDDNCAEQAEVAGEEVSGTFGDVYGKCCLSEADEPFFSPVIQERAWTSPIWYTPG
ncbi:MAG: hypothetical protein ACI9B9_001231 [Halioglobus sp.]|jgi:hypothetical protein